jgi:hypothetical protein
MEVRTATPESDMTNLGAERDHDRQAGVLGGQSSIVAHWGPATPPHHALSQHLMYVGYREPSYCMAALEEPVLVNSHIKKKLALTTPASSFSGWSGWKWNSIYRRKLLSRVSSDIYNIPSSNSSERWLAGRGTSLAEVAFTGAIRCCVRAHRCFSERTWWYEDWSIMCFLQYPGRPPRIAFLKWSTTKCVT